MKTTLLLAVVPTAVAFIGSDTLPISLYAGSDLPNEVLQDRFEDQVNLWIPLMLDGSYPLNASDPNLIGLDNPNGPQSTPSDEPKLEWSVQLPTIFGQGNVIVPSPWEENVVYATSSDGKVVVVWADGSVDTYTPPLILSGSTVAVGGLSFSRAGVIVYAVCDKDYRDGRLTSRIVALSPDLREGWVTPVAGEVVGTPLIMKEGALVGKYLAAIYNDMDGGSHLGVWHVWDGSLLLEESFPVQRASAPALFENEGKQGILWTATGAAASIYSCTLPMTLGRRSSLDVERKSVSWESKLPPVVNTESDRAYFTTTEGGIVSVQIPSIIEEWLTSVMDSDYIYKACPAISSDGLQVIVGLGNGSVVGLDARSGAQMWKAQASDAEVAVPPVVSSDNRIVVVASLTEVSALDQADGTLLWSIPVASAIRASMSMSASALLVAHASGRIDAYNIQEEVGPLPSSR